MTACRRPGAKGTVGTDAAPGKNGRSETAVGRGTVDRRVAHAGAGDSLSDINYINDLEATGEFGEFVCYTYGEKHGGRCVFYTKDKKLTKLTKPLLIY